MASSRDRSAIVNRGRRQSRQVLDGRCTSQASSHALVCQHVMSVSCTETLLLTPASLHVTLSALRRGNEGTAPRGPATASTGKAGLLKMSDKRDGTGKTTGTGDASSGYDGLSPGPMVFPALIFGLSFSSHPLQRLRSSKTRSYPVCQKSDAKMQIVMTELIRISYPVNVVK